MILSDLFTDYTLRNVALGSALLGVTGGVVGGFTMLRRQSLLGDAVAHAALPGVCLAFLLTGSKAPLWLLLGGGLSGWLGALGVGLVLKYTRLNEDAALGTMLSAFFGFGIALLTFIAGSGNANQAGLDKFLFGQAATIVAGDVTVMALLSALALGTVWMLFKEFKLLTFDPAYAHTLGFPVERLGVVQTSLAVLAVVIGLQTVGVVLMAALLIAPPAAARQWTDNLGKMLLLSGLFGILSGVAGAVISASTANLPTGPVIVVVASMVLLISLFFAPKRGLLWSAFASAQRRKVLREAMQRGVRPEEEAVVGS